MRMSVSTFQLSPRIKDDCGSASKVFTTLVDLSVSGICDLTSSSLCYPFRQIESTFDDDVSDLLVDLNRLLRGSGRREEVAHVDVLMNRSDNIFVVDCIIFRHFVQGVICTIRRAFRPKNISCVLIDFYSPLWLFSPEKS